MGLTPKERHREGVLKYWGSSCYARAKGGCSGRIQAAHWISSQTLRHRQANNRIALKNGRELHEAARYLVDMPIGGLVSDPRNGIPLCEAHHASFDGRDGKRLEMQPPLGVKEFAADYGLEDLL